MGHAATIGPDQREIKLSSVYHRARGLRPATRFILALVSGLARLTWASLPHANEQGIRLA